MQSLKIFVVEDDRFVARVMQQRIERLGYNDVQHFPSGNEALDALGERPDMVFLDYFLPGLNGLSTLQSIKKRLPSCDVVVVSGTKDPDLVHELFEAGATDFLMKRESGYNSIEGLLAECQHKKRPGLRWRKWLGV